MQEYHPEPCKTGNPIRSTTNSSNVWTNCARKSPGCASASSPHRTRIAEEHPAPFPGRTGERLPRNHADAPTIFLDCRRRPTSHPIWSTEFASSGAAPPRWHQTSHPPLDLQKLFVRNAGRLARRGKPSSPGRRRDTSCTSVTSAPIRGRFETAGTIVSKALPGSSFLTPLEAVSHVGACVSRAGYGDPTNLWRVDRASPRSPSSI